jgi:hypothetical protein
VSKNDEFPCVFVPFEKKTRCLRRPFRTQKRPENALKRGVLGYKKNAGGREWN